MRSTTAKKLRRRRHSQCTRASTTLATGLTRRSGRASRSAASPSSRRRGRGCDDCGRCGHVQQNSTLFFFALRPVQQASGGGFRGACAPAPRSGTPSSPARSPCSPPAADRTYSGQFLCQLTPTLFRPFLAHFCSFFPVFSPFAPFWLQDSGNRHQDPDKRSATVEKRRVKNPKLT